MKQDIIWLKKEIQKLEEINKARERRDNASD